MCLCACPARVGVSCTCRKYLVAAVRGTSGEHFKLLNIIDLFLAQNIAEPGLTFVDRYHLFVNVSLMGFPFYSVQMNQSTFGLLLCCISVHSG